MIIITIIIIVNYCYYKDDNNNNNYFYYCHPYKSAIISRNVYSWAWNFLYCGLALTGPQLLA